MRSIILAIILAASALLPAAASECLPSAHAVRQAHGQGAWSDIHTIHGRKCYSLGERHGRSRTVRSGLPRDVAYRDRNGNRALSQVIPIVPGVMPLLPQFSSQAMAQWDAEWESLLAARERRGPRLAEARR